MVYCGNNLLSPESHEVGTSSECFRKGFGGGYYSGVIDESFEGPYYPLMENKVYCGDGEVPEGKVRATLAQCVSMGWGSGMKKRVEDDRRIYENNKGMIFWVVVMSIILYVIVSVSLIMHPPDFILGDRDEEGERKVVISRVILVLSVLFVIIFCVSGGIIVWNLKR